jgi:hypothetical protein
MGNSVLWILVVFLGGGFVLAAAIAWSMNKNRKSSKAEVARTEAATRARYDGDTVDRHGH